MAERLLKPTLSSHPGDAVDEAAEGATLKAHKSRVLPSWVVPRINNTPSHYLGGSFLF
ncbi:UNVERIFIED_CONTAM: hypothetical protein Cloal_1574 [Acetivibrio alkalicellulosi]